MIELLTAEQMRAIEKAAIESREVSGLELMERAGQGVVEAIFEEWPVLAAPSERGAEPSRSPRCLERDERPLRVVVLCGPGNNGGDGFVISRLLRQEGWDVEVFLYGDRDKLPPDARVNYERWLELGAVRALADCRLDHLENSALVVDALFGTGLTRPLPELAELFANIGALMDRTYVRAAIGVNCPAVVSIDIPSGVCADSGKTFPTQTGVGAGDAVSAHLTVTFHGLKLGHILAEGPEYVGRLVIKDIGLERVADCPSASRNAIEALYQEKRIGRRVASFVEGPLTGYLVKGTDAFKFTHGHALILSGGVGTTGAARLAARGALRVGAGLVTLGVPPSGLMEVASQITALMCCRVGGAEGLAEVLQDKRISALCLGPGLGTERARALVPVALAVERPTVLDADALSAYQEDPEQLFGLLHESCVLTPHGGEFARLFPDLAERLNAPAVRGPAYSKVDATRDAAQRAGCTVLFKGADTVIADPKGRCCVHAAVRERAAPWLATAGSGDVLAGFITGLLARGFGPVSAASSAVWLHVECARQFGPGLIAEDLPEILPRVLSGILDEAGQS